jgi:hypothetical protein
VVAVDGDDPLATPAADVRIRPSTYVVCVTEPVAADEIDYRRHDPYLQVIIDHADSVGEAMARPTLAARQAIRSSSEEDLPATREALAHGRPRVGPSITQNSGPAGRLIRSVSQGRRCSQPQLSIPVSRRRPPLPRQSCNYAPAPTAPQPLKSSAKHFAASYTPPNQHTRFRVFR